MSTSNLPPIPESRLVPPRPARPPQRAAGPAAAPPTEQHPSPINRHPFYGRFVTGLEVLAGALVLWAVYAGVRTWWDLAPMSYEGSVVSELESELRADARYAGISTLISWLGLAGSVLCIAMVGRLLLSIEGILLRDGQATAR